jgi:predicted DCC family thiol-disulfide oxidoreductase YuxK
MHNERNSPPPLIAPSDTVVLFDGTCKLCNGWARFVIAHDQAHRIKLATVQSSQGQTLLAWAGLPTSNFNTIVLISGDEFFVRSAAMFEITARLPAPWRWLRIARVVPQKIRDWMYDKIAVNRYKLFGQYDSIHLPVADHEHRFLKTNS